MNFLHYNDYYFFVLGKRKRRCFSFVFNFNIVNKYVDAKHHSAEKRKKKLFKFKAINFFLLKQNKHIYRSIPVSHLFQVKNPIGLYRPLRFC